MSDPLRELGDTCKLCGEHVLLRFGRDGGTPAISTWKCPRCHAVQPTMVAATILSVTSRYPKPPAEDGSGN